MWVSLVLLKIFNEIDFNILEYVKDIKPYDVIKENISVVERQKLLFNTGVLNEYVETLDNELGDDGRLIVRSSGTESVIRVLIEGGNHQLMRSVAKKIRQKIQDL